MIRVVLSRWDTTNLLHEEIASSIYTGTPTETYSRFSFPIQYINTNPPYTAAIELLSSNAPIEAPILGSILVIDDLEFSNAIQTGVSNVGSRTKLRIFPNL